MAHEPFASETALRFSLHAVQSFFWTGVVMAESGLSLGYTELSQRVGFYLGYGRTTLNWSAGQLVEINEVVQSGVRRVYYPPAVQGVQPGFEWSFLRPSIATLITNPIYSTGTITVVAGVVTLVTGVWPAWAAQGTLKIGTTWYEIETRDSDEQITLTEAGVDEDALTEYQIVNRDYDLPDDFGRLYGDIKHNSDNLRYNIQVISNGGIYSMRSSYVNSGEPAYASVQYKVSDLQEGQRHQLMLYPDPDAAYVLSYKYERYSGEISDSYPYPLGGMKFSELYLESCLSVAEQNYNDEVGIHTSSYQRLLIDAVSRDEKQGAQQFGFVGDVGSSDYYDHCFRRGYTGGAYPITYKGSNI